MVVAVATGVSHADSQTPAIESANIATGLQFYEQQRWGVVQAVVVNRSDATAEPLLAVNFTKDKLTQFCNRVWLPPHARRVIHTPIYPGEGTAAQDDFALETRLISEVAGEERAAAPVTGNILHRDGRFNTAMLIDPDDEYVRRVVGALRDTAGLQPTNTYLSPAAAPVFTDAYEALGGLIVATHQPDLDAAQMDALYRWIVNGGRLWVMLDQTDPDWLVTLLGRDGHVSIVDRVELSRFAIAGASEPTEQVFDYGVEHVRVVGQGYDVTHRINSSPAAMRRSIGRGEVLLTTLDARGWLVDAARPTPALKDLTWFVHRSDAEAVLSRERIGAFEDYARRQIGYRILNRGWVVLVISLLAATLLTSAISFHRRGHLEYNSVLGLFGTVIATVILVALGVARQTEVDTSVVVAQLIEADPELPYANVSEAINIYTSPGSAGRALAINNEMGSMLIPARKRDSHLTRIVWSNPNHSRIGDLQTRSGSVTSLVARNDIVLENTPNTMVRFDQRGVEVHFDGSDFSVVGQPLLVTPTGSIALQPDGDGVYHAGQQDVLQPAEFTSQAILDQTQIARQNVYRELLQDASFPRQPSFMTWTDRVPTGVTYTGDAQTRGQALLVMPIRFAQPEIGTRVHVPSPVFEMTPFRGPLASHPRLSTTYNPDTGKWISNVHEPMLVLIRFKLPSVLTRMKIESAQLLVDMRAPGRQYKVIAVDTENASVLDAGANPLGRTIFELSGGRVPVVQSDGSVIIGVDVGPFTDPAKSRPWTINRMEFSASGIIE